ncbi:MAG: hypothetical protein GWN58_33090 [Anaerolineae bacterium]|nr:hypothetical protein [Thermoplasmata archaeon]NIV34111.1 hypothetical protein [Anaerolineae bacterium]NIY05962.1 hypothetical protein [Thermoplasmata archaeon]
MTNLTEREELISAYSDGYKDWAGFRPRDRALYEGPIEELRAAVDWVYKALAEEMEREREQERAERLAAERGCEPAEVEPESFPTAGDGWSFTPAEAA